MAIVDVIMPQMGESIAEGTITKWYKKVGDKIAKDETLLEISTDKVDSEIPSPSSGLVAELLFPEQKTVDVHTVIARIQTDVHAPLVQGHGNIELGSQGAKPEVARSAQSTHAQSGTQPAAVGQHISTDAGRFFSPLVLNIARTEGISLSELEGISGTGANDRVTKKDILDYVERKKSNRAPAAARTSTPSSPSTGIEIIKMDSMRKAIAEHMVRSVHTSAHVGSVTEADVSKIVAFREKHKAEFERREGFKLTFTPFFVDVVVKAIKDFPMLNASVDGDSILIRKDVNIGVAVALENGLIVPVVKHADGKDLIGLARAVNDLSNRARTKKLLPEDVQGGTFTITNPGIFGNLFGFPIINQPQVAILGVGAIKKRPIVVNDAIAIRSMVYISMSYDHRIIDGALGGMFLQRLVEHLENFDVSKGV
ncbi:MAG TPA: dihydrolipoamide acetyltransferase family protein [Bacteroidota bacterium]|nr:dihydrolipoamide acetyltransferase family protein [Bacteroidota bacterium]